MKVIYIFSHDAKKEPKWSKDVEKEVFRWGKSSFLLGFCRSPPLAAPCGRLKGAELGSCRSGCMFRSSSAERRLLETFAHLPAPPQRGPAWSQAHGGALTGDWSDAEGEHTKHQEERTLLHAAVRSWSYHSRMLACGGGRWQEEEEAVRMEEEIASSSSDLSIHQSCLPHRGGALLREAPTADSLYSELVFISFPWKCRCYVKL